MLMCVGAGIGVGNILNTHQVGEHTCFYLNCDGYSFYRIVTNMKFMLMCVGGTCLVLLSISSLKSEGAESAYTVVSIR
jgi:hypothetical protein